MSGRAGIIYWSTAIFRRSSAYPNGRLLVIGALLLPWAMIPDPVAAIPTSSVSPSPQVIQAVTEFSRIRGAVAIVAYFVGMTLIVFGSSRIGVNLCRRRIPAKLPASTPDAASKAD
jgi:H+/gluconate symporter-like permease